jgi:peptidoglycan/LPS O-acetylase OafA/YrhL
VALPQVSLPDEASRWITYAAIAIATPLAFSATRDLAFDRWLGELSYPMYLCHLLIVAFVLAVEPEHGVLVAVGATLALSALLVIAIEQPVDRWRQARVRYPAPPTP